MNAQAHPFYFGPAGAESFGWLHEPSTTARADMGLVICSPFGDEDQASHRGLRRLAIMAADAGVPTLRFDYHGSGDSAGTDGEHDHPTSWLRSVHTAIDTLRDRAGVTRVCLVAARLGALPAVRAASERGDICALVALAPVVRGHRFLREALLRDPGQSARGRDDFELAGYVITARARAELGAIDLVDLVRPPAAHVLVVDADGLHSSDRWLARLGEQGVRVETFVAPELTTMLEARQGVTVPQALLARIAAWIGARAAQAERTVARAMPSHVAGKLHLANGVRETPLAIHTGSADLFAVLSELEGGSPRRAVLLLNTGAGRRIGPSRMYVNWARRWACHNIVVMRLDLPGLGDSDVQPGEIESEVYAIDTTCAIAAAVALLRARCGPIECQLVGICSGAFHAYRAAIAGVPAESLTLVNQAAYHWRSNTHIDRPSLTQRLAGELGERRRLVASRLQVSTMRRGARDLKWRAVRCGVAAVGVVRRMARALHLPLPDDIASELRLLAQRKVVLRIVVSDKDSAGALLRLQAGRQVALMEKRGELQIDLIEAADHIFTSRQARARVLVVLDRIAYGNCR